MKHGRDDNFSYHFSYILILHFIGSQILPENSSQKLSRKKPQNLPSSSVSQSWLCKWSHLQKELQTCTEGSSHPSLSSVVTAVRSEVVVGNTALCCHHYVSLLAKQAAVKILSFCIMAHSPKLDALQIFLFGIMGSVLFLHVLCQRVQTKV